MARQRLVLLLAISLALAYVANRPARRPAPGPPPAAPPLVAPAAAPPPPALARQPEALPPALPEPPAGPEGVAPAGPAPIALEDLMRLPGDPRATAGLDVDRNPHLRVPPPGEAEGTGPVLRERVHVEHRSGPVGLPGPKQSTLGETDAGVRVPVKKSVDVWGGVEVDSRRANDGALEDVDSKPKVGVDVRF